MKNGFSLLELLVSLTVAAICTLLCVPIYSDLSKRSEADTTLDSVHAALLLARSKALSEGYYVVACGVNGKGECADSFSGAMMIFADKNRNGQLDSNESVEQYLTLNRAINIKLSSFSGRPYVFFQPTGTTEGGNGSLLFCHQNHDEHFSRKIAWTRAGRIKTSKTGNDGFHYYNNERVACGNS